MKIEEIDLAALQKDLQELTKRRGWFRRNWRWFVPILLLTIIVTGAGAGYWAFYTRVYNLEVCQLAMDSIEADAAMIESLGQPIQTVKWPSRAVAPNARVEEGEIDIIWHVQGPKGQAKAHARSRQRQGKWEMVILEVTLPTGKKMAVHTADAAGNEAAPYVPGANSATPSADAKKPETKGADLNIDLQLPPGDTPPSAK
jgi:hypothetical protein